MKKREIEESIKKRAGQISKVIGRTIIVLIFLLFLSGTFIQFIPNFLKDNTLLRAILIFFTVLLGILGTFAGFNILGFGNKIRGKLKKVIIKFLTSA